MLSCMSRVAARRVGLQSHHLLLRRVRTAVSVQLVRRSVRMLRSCLPGLSDSDEQMLVNDESDVCTFPVTREIVLSRDGYDYVGYST